jgi:hypothetical protein
MFSYEVVRLDASGREAQRQELQCHDNEEAVDRASAMRSPHGVEVWCEGALIWHWEPSAFADDGKLSGEPSIGEAN